MFRRLFQAGLIAAAVACSTAAQAQQTGIYDVSGTNPDGTSYDGTFLLQQVGLVSWRAVWSIAGQRIEGLGMSSGAIFTVAYELGQRTALGIYNVNPDGSMSGQWTVVGSTGLGTEMLTPQAQQPSTNPAPR